MSHPRRPIVYFACSIRGGRSAADWYAELVAMIRNYADILSESFAASTLTEAGSPAPEGETWKADLDMIRNADAVIAEVSVPSLGVGYEIGKAEEWSKPVLCIFKPDGTRKLSAMIRGSEYSRAVDCGSIEEAEVAVQEFVESLKRNRKLSTLPSAICSELP